MGLGYIGIMFKKSFGESQSREADANAYPKATQMFEGFKLQMGEKIAEARAAKDWPRVKRLESEQREVNVILSALAAGDTDPVRTKIADMIRRNTETVILAKRDDLEGEDLREPHSETIRKLTELLLELDAPAKRAEEAA